MIDQAVLADLLGRTKELRAGFAPTASRPWDPATAAAELTVQAGHLAVCLARWTGVDVSGFDDPGRPIIDLGDELADVVLAALSIAVLAGAEPRAADLLPGMVSDPSGALMILLVCAGRLAEAAMVEAGYRHSPAGRPPAVARDCARTVAAAGHLAALVDVDLAEAFATMHADATAFLRANRAGGGR